MSSAEVADYCLDRFFRCGVKCVVRKAFGFKELFYCPVLHDVLGDYSGPVLGVTELETL
jgi:hypothetical protein